MSAITQSKQRIVALLSATAGGEINGSALTIVGGRTLIEHQISTLRQAGVDTFFIEVDGVPGVLTTLANSARKAGCSVDFVSSIEHLASLLGDLDHVIVLDEGVVIAPPILLSLLARPGLFVATVDGRDENSSFERMDLNTRWAGLALVDGRTIKALGPLPEGWSMASSLLRQVMRDRVGQYMVKQHHIQSGEVRKIAKGVGADELSRQILSQRMAREPGFIESRILAPLSGMLAPRIWKNRSGSITLEVGMLASAGLTAALALAGWWVAAFATAILALLTRSMRLVAYDPEMDHEAFRWVQPAFWALLAGAAFAGSTIDGYRTSDSMFAAAMMVGLALLAHQLRLPHWAEKTLKSPVLLAFSALLLTAPLGFATATKWISVIQLILLLVAKWTHKPKT